MSKISFIMPVFQAQAYLAESIQSILNQKLKDIELITVNDCSTDSSKDIIDYYVKKDDRIKCIDLKVNGGMSNARNAGNKVAKSKIIAVQDADDISLPERAGEIVKFFEKNPKSSLFYSSFNLIDEHNNFLDTVIAEKFDIKNVFEKKYTFMGHPTIAYKKSVILKHPYQNGQWSRLGCEDFRLITELWKNKCEFGFSEKILVLYRWHSKNSSRTRNESEVSLMKDKYIKTLKGAEYDTKDVISKH